MGITPKALDRRCPHSNFRGGADRVDAASRNRHSSTMEASVPRPERSHWVVTGVLVDTHESFVEAVDQADAGTPAEAAAEVRARHLPRAVTVNSHLIVAHHSVVAAAPLVDEPLPGTEDGDEGDVASPGACVHVPVPRESSEDLEPRKVRECTHQMGWPTAYSLRCAMCSTKLRTESADVSEDVLEDVQISLHNIMKNSPALRSPTLRRRAEGEVPYRCLRLKGGSACRHW